MNEFFTKLDGRQLHYFKVLCEIGNVTRTADKLFISRTGLSLSIKKLEETIGLPLLERGNDGVKPTAYGVILYQMASEYEKLADSCVCELDRMRKAKKRLVNVSIFGMSCTPELMRLILSFEKTAPELNIRVLDTRDLSYFEALEKGTIDIVIAVRPPENSPLYGIRLMSADQILIVNRENRLYGLDTVDFKTDLRGQTLLESERRMDNYLALIEQFEILRDFIPGDHEIIRSMLSLNKGIVMTPSFFADYYMSEFCAIKKLVNVPPDLDLDPYIVMRKDSDEQICALAEYIASNFLKIMNF